MVASRKVSNDNAGSAPSLSGLNALDIAALIYRIDDGVPLLTDANDSAKRQLHLGERFPMADPWQWLNAQRYPAAGLDHPALQSTGKAVSRQWCCYHIRQHLQPLKALQLKISPLDDTSGMQRSRRVLVAISDIVDVDASQALLPQAQPRLRQFLGSLPMGACVIDADGYLRLINPAFCEFFGYEESELLNAHFRKLFPSALRKAAEARHQASFPNAATQRRAVEVRLRDGSARTVIVEDMISQDDDGEPQRIAFLVDITDRRDVERRLEEKNRRLEYLATRDDLTGLHNRRFGVELLEQALERSQRYGERVAVAMLDLDHFKAINDEYGHSIGDAVLVEFSRFMTRTLRASDTLIRWGGEEFLLILPGIDRFLAESTVNRVLRQLHQRALSPAALKVSFSAGVGEYRRQTADQLLESADQALYQAKAAGRGCVAIAPASIGCSKRRADRSYSSL